MADNDALVELARKADEERLEADRAEGEVREKAAREAAEEAAKAAREEAALHRVPDGFGGTMHSFWAFMIGLLVVAFVGAGALDGELHSWWKIAVPVAAADALYALTVWIYMATWKSGLKYKLTGYDTIAGDGRTGYHRGAWIGFRIRMKPDGHGDPHRAAKLALDVLASRANRMLAKDKDYDAKDEQKWRVTDLEVRGEASRAIYMTGLLRSWLRGEANDVAKRYGIREIVIEARYTGGTFWVSSSD